jgi:hypothetical protein
MALVQKGLLFDCLTTVSVMLERSEASQGGVDFDFDTFLHSGQLFLIKTGGNIVFYGNGRKKVDGPYLAGKTGSTL